MAISPYSGKPESTWLRITRGLVKQHPLTTQELLEATQAAWTILWQSTVGEGELAVKLSEPELRVPATVVGYFFEILLARELARRSPTKWRGNRSKEEKDLVYLPDPKYSVEVKTSGQLGFKIFGNKSASHKSEKNRAIKKEKSGYYLTINFHEQQLTRIRFGWIDEEDWIGQVPDTGQMAGLGKAVYDHKLIDIPGSYRLKTPISLLEGVGPKTAEKFYALGIRTVEDLIKFSGALPRGLSRIQEKNCSKFLAACLTKDLS